MWNQRDSHQWNYFCWYRPFETNVKPDSHVIYRNWLLHYGYTEAADDRCKRITDILFAIIAKFDATDGVEIVLVSLLYKQSFDLVYIELLLRRFHLQGPSFFFIRKVPKLALSALHFLN